MKARPSSRASGPKAAAVAIALRRSSPTISENIFRAKPAVIVQYMPGAAHLSATNHVFNVAKPDGLTILASNPQVAIAQLAKVEQVRFDVRKFIWIGSLGPDGVAFSVRSDLPYKSFEDIRKSRPRANCWNHGSGVERS